MPKQATQVVLSDKEKEGLTKLTKGHKTEKQKILRSQIILYAAQGYSNAKIARELNINIDTARLWRDRWVVLQGIDLEKLSVEERLEDVPRPGKPPRITEEQMCKIAGLACEAPIVSGRPISQWTGKEIADEIKTRGIVEQISARHASRLIKKRVEATFIPLLVNKGDRSTA
jgi:putative transposase